MDEKLMGEFKEQFQQELENAFARGMKSGSIMVVKNVLSKLNQYKRNNAVGAQKVREFCNNVIRYFDFQEGQNEQNPNDI